MRCRMVARSLCIAFPLTHMPSSMVTPSCMSSKDSAMLAMSTLPSCSWTARQRNECHLEPEPVDALKVHNVAIGTNDVWARQREWLLCRLLACHAAAAKPERLTADIDKDTFLTVHEYAAGNKRRSCAKRQGELRSKHIS